MNEAEAKLLANYQRRWADLAAIEALISELESIRRDIKAGQRNLANKLVAARLGESGDG